jgi:hypothetical protein
MSREATLATLDRLGLLAPLRRIKHRLFPCPPERTFRPCTPHLLIAVNRALRYVADDRSAEPGDYLEFGIFRGFTLWYAQALARDMDLRGMRFFGFDSFQGLPEVGGIDLGAEFSTGQYSAGRQEVEGNLAALDVDWTRTVLVEGFFDKTLHADQRRDHALRTCAVAVIDCDLYESTKQVLAWLYPLIGAKTVLLFDDWHNFGDDPAKGEQRAFHEFLDAHPDLAATEFTAIGTHGKGFVVARN